MSDSMSNLETFCEILEIWSTFLCENSHEIRLFIYFFRAIEEVNPAIPLYGRGLHWTTLYNGGIAVLTHKNNHFSETSSTKISQLDISEEPNNWTKCPVSGHKKSVCDTLGPPRLLVKGKKGTTPVWRAEALEKAFPRTFRATKCGVAKNMRGKSIPDEANWSKGKHPHVPRWLK